MTFASVLLLAVGLAMDATAVSAARGMAAKRILTRDVVLVAVLFGGFQALMPLVGWEIGSRLGPMVQAFDHWIAFVLLGGIGAKMLWDARSQPDESPSDKNLFGLKILLLLAVATSIDALAVGVTLPMLQAPFLVSLLTIGVTTALLCSAGLFAGRRFGALLGQKLDRFGGVVLIALGFKFLIEHLSA